jgi:hypothetical protein
MINDIKSSEFLKSLFDSKIKLNLGSDKYLNFDKTSVDIYSSYFKVLREFAWQDHPHYKSENIGRFNEPLQIGIFLDSFTLYYKKCFLTPHKHRELRFDYDHSTVIIEATFGDVVYDITMTLLQSMVFILLNDKGCMTIQEISYSLDVPLSNLTFIFNSLMTSKLVTKTKTSTNCDINAIMKINENWSYKDKTLSIVMLIDRIKEFFNKETKEKELKINEHNSTETFNQIKTILQNSSDELTIDAIKIELGKDYEEVDVLKYLDSLLASDVVTTQIYGEIVKYKLSVHFDSDFDSESESEESESEETEDKESEGEESEGEETEDKESEDKETEDKETEDKETEDKETEDKETEDKETEDKETEDKESEDKESEDKETEDKESEDKETEDKESEGEETEGEETEGEETEGEETEDKDKETEDKETEDKESEGEETEDKESEDKESDGEETEDKETEDKETEDKETEDKSILKSVKQTNIFFNDNSSEISYSDDDGCDSDNDDSDSYSDGNSDSDVHIEDKTVPVVKH